MKFLIKSLYLFTKLERHQPKNRLNIMGREYPTYLLTVADNVKHPGNFVVRTIEPRFIAKLSQQGNKKSDVSIDFIEFFEPIEYGDMDIKAARKVIDKHLINWFYLEKKRLDNPDFHRRKQIISSLEKMTFLKEYRKSFTTDHVREIIRVCFPTRLQKLNKNHTSYGLKHLFERISCLLMEGKTTKYCSNDTAKEAFKLEGFMHDDGLNWCFNISEKEYDFINNLRLLEP